MNKISNKVDGLIDINNVFELLRCKTTDYFGVETIKLMRLKNHGQ